MWGGYLKMLRRGAALVVIAIFAVPRAHSQIVGAFPGPLAGRMAAAAVPAGRSLSLDGRFEGWDLSRMAHTWCFYKSAPYSAHAALNYDKRSLYLAAWVSLPHRAYANPSGPYGSGDLIRFGYMMSPGAGAGAHALRRPSGAIVSLWRDTRFGRDHVRVETGQFDMARRQDNPSSVEMRFASDSEGYWVRARIPWSVLKAPLGICPFARGQTTVGGMQVLWREGATCRCIADGNPKDSEPMYDLPQVEFAGASLAPTDPALRSAARGDAALLGGSPQAAARAYEEAYRTGSSERALGDAERLILERRNIAAVFLSRKRGAAVRAADFGLRLMGLGYASAERRWLGLAAVYAARDGVLNRSDLKAIARVAAALRNPSAGSPKVHVRIVRWVESLLGCAAAAERMRDAVRAECAGQWASAAEGYAAAAAALEGHNYLRAYSGQAARSVALMRMVAAASSLKTARPEESAIIGVDQTLGGDWRGAIGSEAWVLCALHGADLCGGPRLLDGGFAYRPRNPDPQNSVRYWRDPWGFPAHPVGDTALADPASPGEYACSFWDDNGEDYPPGCGPDLDVDITIPPGPHYLTMPLHFSDPAVRQAHYGVYVRTASAVPNPAAAASEKTSEHGVASHGETGGRIVAVRVVSVSDTPGYLRIRLVGPASYTVVLRRLDSFNANIQALFLDPAGPAVRRVADTVLKAFAGDGAAAAAGVVTAPGSAWALIDRLRPATIDAVDAARRSGDETEFNAIADAAQRYVEDGSAPSAVRTIAAVGLWWALECCALRSGERQPAFQRALDMRYPARAGGVRSGDAKWLAELRSLSSALRSADRPELAVLVDRRAVDIAITGFATVAPSEIGARFAAESAFAHDLWTWAAIPYLAPSPARFCRGDGLSGARDLNLATDAGFAGEVARRIVGFLLGSEYVAATDVHAQRARMWLDATRGELSRGLNGSRIDMPFANIIYAEACEPLMGSLRAELPPGYAVPPELAFQRLPKRLRIDRSLPPAPTAKNGACLLLPYEMEALARAWIGRRLFISDSDFSDTRRAAALLRKLLNVSPRYPGAAQIAGLLRSLDRVGTAK